MCGRYAMAVAPENLPEYFGLNNLQVDEIINSDVNSEQQRQHEWHNIGPTRYAPIYYYRKDGDVQDRRHVVEYLNWGLVPHWTKKRQDLVPWKRFNAKKETMLQAASVWRSSMSKKRCVIPMQGYYEWLHRPVQPGTKKVDKIPYYIKRKDNKLMFLAGLRDHCSFKDDPDAEGHVDMATFTIITGPSPKPLQWLHERMPIVLIPGTEEFEKWLDPDRQEWNGDLADCLREYARDDLEWYEVSKTVNKLSGSGPELVEPVKNSQKGIMSFFSIPRGGVKIEPDAAQHKIEKEPLEKKADVMKEEHREADIKTTSGYKYVSRKKHSAESTPTSSPVKKKQRSLDQMKNISTRVKSERESN